MSTASTQFEDERHLHFTMQKRHRQAALEAQLRMARAPYDIDVPTPRAIRGLLVRYGVSIRRALSRLSPTARSTTTMAQVPPD